MSAQFVSKFVLALSGAALAVAPVAASAQGRDPAYAAARASGQVGEKMDGYLGTVGTPNGQLRAMVDDLNIKRKAAYAAKAQAANATIEEYALSSGCQLILNTQAGEKYQAPDGSWQTRGSAVPMRDSRCP